jgi:hypothetical protein
MEKQRRRSDKVVRREATRGARRIETQPWEYTAIQPRRLSGDAVTDAKDAEKRAGFARKKPICANTRR